jgi:hypothetical protein
MSRRTPTRRTTPSSLGVLQTIGAALSSTMDSKSPTERRRGFAEDFNMEHSSSLQEIDLRAAADSATSRLERADNAATRFRHSSTRTSPTCIYFG